MNNKDVLVGLSMEKQQFLREAVKALEFPQPLARISQFIGEPVERAVRMLPGYMKKVIFSATEKALENALKVSLSTVPQPQIKTESFEAMEVRANKAASKHRLGTVASGAAGGFFGAWGLAFELPLTTTVMLRSIASIAQAFGEDLSKEETKLECLKVFAFGSPHESDKSNDTSYYSTRVLLRRFLPEIAARFEVAVSQKAVAQFLPGLGAGTGALINGAFSQHFNLVSKYHFGLRALEREHGAPCIQAAYSQIFRDTKRA